MRNNHYLAWPIQENRTTYLWKISSFYKNESFYLKIYAGGLRTPNATGPKLSYD